VSSCANGHPVSPGTEYCGSCGEDVRPRCYQGHRSAVGARFCDTCGALLGPGAADGPAPELVTEYTSGSLLEILAEDAGDPAGAGPPAPGWPTATPFAAGKAASPAEARDDDDPSTLTDFGAVDAGDGEERHGGRRRPRGPVTVLVVALLVVAGVAGFTLLHHRSAQPASAGPSHGAAVTASASPTASHALSPADRSAKWTAPTPLDQEAAQIGNPTITGVSCPEPTMCYAVDSAGAILSSTATGSWQTVATDSASAPVAISCASTTFCLVLDQGDGAITLSQGIWGSPVLVDSRVGTFTAASCPTPTFCMAVDSGGSAYAYTGPAAGWQPFTVDPSGTGLTSVSCTSAVNCVAVGQAGDVFTYDGSSWSAGQSVDNGNALAAVSCASPVFCVAVGHSGNAAVFSGGRWAVSALGVGADAVACPTGGYCVAVDGSGGALVYRDGGWLKVANIDGTNAIEAVSCPAVAICTATDSLGNVMYYSSAAAAG
jgi:hypothetical protein